MSKWDKYKEQRKQWRKDNPDKVKDYRLRREFGITLKQYNEMYDEQDGRCAICRSLETMADHRSGKVKTLSIDHDHTTGRVRALLCNACNTGLGKFKDDLELLLMASIYLETYK